MSKACTRCGARFLARGVVQEATEGAARVRCAVIACPAQQAGRDGYTSAEYQRGGRGAMRPAMSIC